MNRETEILIVAVQNQSMQTILVKAKINKSQKDTLCWLCKKAHESIDASGCSKLAQKYKRRHDNLSKIIHWKLARKSSFKTGDKSVLKVFEARKCFRE